MRVAVTGANGFLGRHVALAARAAGHVVAACDRNAFTTQHTLTEALKGAEYIVHCAGMNRGDQRAVETVNIDLARQLASSLPATCHTLVFANSRSAGEPNAYGTGKAAAAEILAKACAVGHIEYVDVRLPNLYGEGGRPKYNSVTATFVHAAVAGEPLEVIDDRPMSLLHVSDAATALLECSSGPLWTGQVDQVTVGELRSLILTHVEEYRTGRLIPSLTTNLERHVFNMIRDQFPVDPEFLQPEFHTDARGALFEGIRHQGTGQVFFSTSVPGARRGDHYHVRKFERFIVLHGSARVTCKDLLGRRGQYSVMLSSAEGGSRIADMHTYETHTLENVGTDPLIVAFWISEHLDPASPDTIRDVLEIPVAVA